MAFGIVIGIGVHIKADHFKSILAVESYGVLVTALGLQYRHSSSADFSLVQHTLH